MGTTLWHDRKWCRGGGGEGSSSTDGQTYEGKESRVAKPWPQGTPTRPNQKRALRRWRRWKATWGKKGGCGEGEVNSKCDVEIENKMSFWGKGKVPRSEEKIKNEMMTEIRGKGKMVGN